MVCMAVFIKSRKKRIHFHTASVEMMPLYIKDLAHPVTFQHAEVHGIIGSLWHTEHHLQAIFYLPLSFLTACEQLLRKINTIN